MKGLGSMGFKKSLKYRLLGSAVKGVMSNGLQTGNMQGISRWLKKIALIAVTAGLVFLICSVLLVSFTVNKVSNIVSTNAVEVWSAKTEQEAGRLIESGKAPLMEAFSKYTGIAKEFFNLDSNTQ
jgi:hypothetical protein